MKWNDLLQSNTSTDLNISSKSDTRSEFEKDYQKIVGSVSFRRLQDKTQVFPLDKSDFIRTRLTHSIEVSSFARTLAEMVSNKILEEKNDKTFLPYMKEDISHILECAGLIHDIGNPPFGHFGEVAIKTWFTDGLKQTKYKGQPLNKILSKEMISDFTNFDGNAQGLRLVTKLNFGSLRPEQSLTYALLGTIIKYPNSFSMQNKKSNDVAKKKQGYFYSERDVYKKIENACGLKNKRHPLTYLLEAADDIAYSTADIEDGYKKGFIKFDELTNEITIVETNANKCKTFNVFNSVDLLLKYREVAIQNNIKNPEEYAISKWIIDLQNYLLSEVSKCFIKNYDLIMNGKYKKDLFDASFAKEIVSLLKDIGWRYIFDTPFIYGPEVRSWHVYEFLLKKFVRAVLYYDTNLSKSKLSPIDKKIFTMIDSEYVRNYHNESFKKNENEKLYLRLKLVVDFISSMTDTKAITMYQELSGII